MVERSEAFNASLQSLIFDHRAPGKKKLVGGFKYVLFSPRSLGEMIQFDEYIFQMGWNHHLENMLLVVSFFFFKLWAPWMFGLNVPFFCGVRGEVC